MPFYHSVFSLSVNNYKHGRKGVRIGAAQPKLFSKRLFYLSTAQQNLIEAFFSTVNVHFFGLLFISQKSDWTEINRVTNKVGILENKARMHKVPNFQFIFG